MSRREVFAEVVTPLRLPDGYVLQPGQSIDTREIESIGEETIRRCLEEGSVAFRTRLTAEADDGLIESAVLADTIERNRAEAAALARALGTVADRRSGPDAATSQGGARASDGDGCPSHAGTADTSRGLALSLLALAWAHRELRRDFDALVDKLTTSGRPA